MDLAKLRYMADQIARNFAAIGHDDAVAATADHLARFWEPRMKAALLADDPQALSPVVREAVARLRRGAVDRPQSRATRFNVIDGIGRSDAG